MKAQRLEVRHDSCINRVLGLQLFKRGYGLRNVRPVDVYVMLVAEVVYLQNNLRLIYYS